MEKSPDPERSLTLHHSSAGLRGSSQESREVIRWVMTPSQLPCVGALSFLVAILGGCTVGTSWAAHAGSAQAASTLTRRQPVDEFDPKTACAQVVEAHNRLRAEAKLPRLVVSAKLQAAAERHAKDMAAQAAMTHKGSDHSDPVDRIKATGYQYRRAGENIAAGRFGIERLMKGWMDSPHHKRNILGSFSQIGVAYATDAGGKRYWCVTFGLPARR
jgi:Cysteine-rich secretory protein family